VVIVRKLDKGSELNAAGLSSSAVLWLPSRNARSCQTRNVKMRAQTGISRVKDPKYRQILPKCGRYRAFLRNDA
jgi:hypothetical protein